MGLDADGFAKCLSGLTKTSLLAQELAQVGPGPRVGGIEPHRLAERGLGGIVAALEVERHSQASVEGGAFGLERERFTVGRLRLGVAPLATEAQRQVGPGEIGRASCGKECRSRWSPY